MMQCVADPTSSISFLCCVYCTGCHSSCRGSRNLKPLYLPGSPAVGREETPAPLPRAKILSVCAWCLP
uniref:Uncharacterized protein n=1 Tax=Arundo donax TaxID=35708 RepID=A0A0A9C456_ARUDO